MSICQADGCLTASGFSTDLRISSHQPLTTAKARATSSYYSIPFLRNRRFVDRAKELEELEKRLIMSEDCQKLALVGLDGVGNT